VVQTPKGAELRHYRASDGQPVQVLRFPVPEAPVVVHFHGNGTTVADVADAAWELQSRGVAFVAVEYRGYGTSPTEGPSEAGFYADAQGVLDGLIAEGTPRERIVLWGSSLGSGIAVEMAIRGYGRRLVLSTPFTSVPEVASRIFPLLPMRLVVTDAFDNRSKAPRVALPTLIFHGDRDGLVPYTMGVELSRAIPDAELITVKGGRHGDLFVRERERLLNAVERHAKGVM
jgi:hypothetical protein